MTDYVYVVRKGDRYIADPFHHLTHTKTLIRARLFLTETAARDAARVHGGEHRLVQMQEIECDTH